MSKPRIAVFSGPTATIHNSEPLVTSNQARARHGLPLLMDVDDEPLRWDIVRPQRLAAPVRVLVEAFSAHPLERDAAHLYAPPDGYLGADGVLRPERMNAADTPVYEVELRPEDGLYLLPYMARQADGRAWESDEAGPLAPAERSRQPFYPDASRIVEEIDRFGIDARGWNNVLSAYADFDFYRAAPPGGYTRGLPAAERTDAGEGDIPPEQLGVDFFPYRPRHLAKEPPRTALARLTNCVRRALAGDGYTGAIWLEGSPSVEETTYWLNLVIDTTAPICGNAAQRPHGGLSNDGDHNIVDSVSYIRSRAWADADGRDSIGGVLIQDQQVFSARDVQKADARPGGYVATGGHGGVVGAVGHGDCTLTYRPVRLHTYRSEVNLGRMPACVAGVARADGRLVPVDVHVKDADGDLLAAALPVVTLVKWGRYLNERTDDDTDGEVEILGRIEKNLRDAPLAGFVGEGKSPYGTLNNPMEAALRRAALCGMPSVRVGRGNNEGFARGNPRQLYIGGGNLTATKARLLLIACLLRFGALPPATDPDHPTDAELAAVQTKLAAYQAVFDTH